MKLSKSFTTVTPLSKIIALILFIVLPFAGFFIGVKYQSVLDTSIKNFPLPSVTPINPHITMTLPSISPLPSGPGSVSVTSISPGQGPTGTLVTILGTGFTQTQDYIQFGSAYLGPFTSIDGKSISFSVPEKAYGGCNKPFSGPIHCMAIMVQQTTPQVYNLQVLTQRGTSNIITFQVTR